MIEFGALVSRKMELTLLEFRHRRPLVPAPGVTMTCARLQSPRIDRSVER